MATEMIVVDFQGISLDLDLLERVLYSHKATWIKAKNGLYLIESNEEQACSYVCEVLPEIPERPTYSCRRLFEVQNRLSRLVFKSREYLGHLPVEITDACLDFLSYWKPQMLRMITEFLCQYLTQSSYRNTDLQWIAITCDQTESDTMIQVFGVKPLDSRYFSLDQGTIHFDQENVLISRGVFMKVHGDVDITSNSVRISAKSWVHFYDELKRKSLIVIGVGNKDSIVDQQPSYFFTETR